MRLVGGRCSDGFIIYAGEPNQRIDWMHLIHYSEASNAFEQDWECLKFI